MAVGRMGEDVKPPETVPAAVEDADELELEVVFTDGEEELELLELLELEELPDGAFPGQV